MSWRTAATVLIIAFVVLSLQSILASPMVEVTGALNATGDYSNQYFNGNALITGYLDSWFDMGLIAVFGMMGWGVARVLRREITRGRQ